MGISLVGLLAGIIVAATLIGVYMTQKHTEQMVSLVSNAVDGKKVQQTISINVQENMAAIFSSSGNYSTTVLYDYRRDIITIRNTDSSGCYVLRMDKPQTPSIRDFLRHMDYIRTHNASSSQITYSITPEQTAHPMDVGMSVHLLCSDVAIYWAKLLHPDHVRIHWPEIEISFSIKF